MSDSTIADAEWHRTPCSTGHVSFHHGSETSETDAPRRSRSRSTSCIASVTSGSDDGQSTDSLTTARRSPRTSVTSASP